MLLIGGLLPLVAAGKAEGADVRGDRTSRATLAFGAQPTNGVFEKDGDKEWYRVRLKKGVTYAFGLDAGGGDFRLFLRNAAGKIVKSSNFGLASDTDAGLEFTVKTAGIYFVEVVGDTGGLKNVRYRVLAHIDCAASPRTDCSLRVGKTAERLLTWGGDRDWFKVSLRVGLSYTFNLIEGPESPHITLLDAKRKVVAEPKFQGDDIERFTPPKNGTYYLQVVNLGEQVGGRYKVSLTRP